jgi:hypothetical protein
MLFWLFMLMIILKKPNMKMHLSQNLLAAIIIIGSLNSLDRFEIIQSSDFHRHPQQEQTLQ